ncbi:hypothetical protein CR105_03140 [Massilia eurypsychrophila]|uniref:DUF3037 domain-containing protein n=1 Tax=Massilia eurypsychrophila TaxID=1485217 RepID=A0A2G8TJ70_9BURK|nr:DUF3037 domain-containing protein [Massilia eurypsychrophila]PIL46101.1 hypothetical protein CR105_03140 [Massilia eurypsychrophila]
MKKRNHYSYSILKYVHDTATAEFVNVGVAVYSAKDNFFQVSCRSTVGRLSEMFPDMQASSFRALMRGLSKRFNELSDAVSSPLDLEAQSTNIERLLASVLPKDDSALVWSEPSFGMTHDPRKTLTDLFSRYVTKYDHSSSPHKRTDEDMWKDFKKELENRHISAYFEEKIIEGKDDEITFKSAWKNGYWHCVEPVSFDLSVAETIREKAHRVLGQITSVSDTPERFKVYLLVGKPGRGALTPALEKALGILDKLPVEKEIFMEDERDLLLDRLAAEISTHNQENERPSILLDAG